MDSSIPFWLWTATAALIGWPILKLASLKATDEKPGTVAFVLFSPVLSTRSWNEKLPADQEIVKGALTQAALLFIPFAFTWWLYFTQLPPLHLSTLAQGYFAVIPFYFMMQFASAVLQLVFLPTGWLFPAHLRYPHLSKSLGEFWGSRWATWVDDWLKQMVFDRNRTRPTTALVGVRYSSSTSRTSWER